MNLSFKQPLCVTHKQSINRIVGAILQLRTSTPAALDEQQRLMITLGLVDHALMESSSAEAPILDVGQSSVYNALDASCLSALFDNNAIELLPYALEALVYENADISNSWHDRRGGLLTHGKKAKGVYFTPYDIARHMCMSSIDELIDVCGVGIDEARFADLSCGTGVFALCLLAELKSRGFMPDFDSALDFFENRFRGYDANALTVIVCRYCIGVVLRGLYPDEFSSHRANLALTASIQHTDSLADESQDAFLEYSPHCVIGNPPYVSTRGGGNTCIDFLHVAMTVADGNAVISHVLPISVSCNRAKPYRATRMRIALTDTWNARFEHYDRSPDALFGDDVRTRIVVLRLSRNNRRRDRYICTTGLSRWVSSNRAMLFEDMPKRGTPVLGKDVLEFVPKIETPVGMALFSEVTKAKEPSLAGMIAKRGVGRCSGYYPTIVYNWILALDHNPPSHDANGEPYVPDSLRTCNFACEDDMYYFIGILNSVTAFWFWTVESDGFHLSSHLLKALNLGRSRFDVSTAQRISECGRKLCRQLPEHKKSSINSGKTIVRYNHLPELQTIFEIDDLVLGALGTDANARLLHNWYRDYLDCARNDAQLLGYFDYLKETKE